jgi:hypothetical protein
MSNLCPTRSADSMNRRHDIGQRTMAITNAINIWLARPYITRRRQ